MCKVNFIGSPVVRTLSEGAFTFSLVLLLSGIDINGSGLFASAYAQDSELSEKATIVIESVSYSAAKKGRTLKVTSYKDAECSRRGKTDRVFRKNYASGMHSFKPLEVETDTPFVFQVSYLEKRRSESRSCVAISSVELKPRRRYSAVFNVVGEVVGCNISVFDVTDSPQTAGTDALDQNPENLPIADAKPELTCAKVGKHGDKSGTAVYSYEDRL